MLTIKGGKSEILRSLKSRSREKIIFVKSKVSIQLIAEILNKTTAKKIVFSKGVYKLLPKKALLALQKIRVKVAVKEIKKGKKSKYSMKTLARIIRFRKRHYSTYEIAEKLNMPLRTVYYYLRKQEL